jgi:hypothetical protein
MHFELASNALEELKALREEREKTTRATMTREQQLEADLARERQMREELETKLKEESSARIYEKQDVLVNAIAAKHVDNSPVKMRAVRRELAEYIESLPKSQVSKLTEKDLDRWCAKFVKENPEFAVKVPEIVAPVVVQEEAPVAAKPVGEPIRKPAGTAPAKRPMPAPAVTNQDASMSNGKTIKPGLPNSMSRAELRAELSKRGMRGWK